MAEPKAWLFGVLLAAGPYSFHEGPLEKAGVSLGHLEQEADQLCPRDPGLFAELSQPVAEGRRDGHVEVPLPAHMTRHIKAGYLGVEVTYGTLAGDGDRALLG